MKLFKNNNYYLFILYVLLLSTISLAWIKQYNLGDATYINDIIELTDGSYICVASIYDTLWHSQCGVLKTDQYGDSLWFKTYGHNIRFSPWNIICVDSINLYMISGECQPDISIDSNDLTVLCVDELGDSIFLNYYDFGLHDIYGSIVKTPDNEFIVGGLSVDSTSYGNEIALAKIKNNGSLSWLKTQPFPDGWIGYGAGKKILMRSDGHFYSIAYLLSMSSPHIWQSWVIKFTPEGDSSLAYLNELESSEVRSAEIVSDSILYIGGSNWVSGSPNLWFWSVDNNLIFLWENTFSYPYSIIIANIIETMNGEILAACQCNWDWLMLVLFDKDTGDTIWTKNYDIHISGSLNMKTASNGDFIVVGSLDDSLNSGFIMRVDSLGNDVPTGIAEYNNISKPDIYYIFTHPNPFNSAVRIYVETQNLASLQIEIFDINGRRVAQLPSPSVPLPGGEGGDSFSHWEKVAEGRMRAITWQPSESLPSGVYLVRARFDNRSLSGAEASGSGTITKRIVYLK